MLKGYFSKIKYSYFHDRKINLTICRSGLQKKFEQTVRQIYKYIYLYKSVQKFIFITPPGCQ